MDDSGANRSQGRLWGFIQSAKRPAFTLPPKLQSVQSGTASPLQVSRNWPQPRAVVLQLAQLAPNRDACPAPPTDPASGAAFLGGYPPYPVAGACAIALLIALAGLRPTGAHPASHPVVPLERPPPAAVAQQAPPFPGRPLLLPVVQLQPFGRSIKPQRGAAPNQRGSSARSTSPARTGLLVFPISQGDRAEP